MRAGLVRLRSSCIALTLIATSLTLTASHVAAQATPRLPRARRPPRHPDHEHDSARVRRRHARLDRSARAGTTGRSEPTTRSTLGSIRRRRASPAARRSCCTTTSPDSLDQIVLRLDPNIFLGNTPRGAVGAVGGDGRHGHHAHDRQRQRGESRPAAAAAGVDGARAAQAAAAAQAAQVPNQPTILNLRDDVALR